MKISTVSVNCPTCQKEVLMIPSSEFRPFCSKRCQLIDLGEWASENYKMPASDQDESWSEDLLR